MTKVKEIWKDIPGFKEYQVSDLGRVKSFKGVKPRILKPRNHPLGYQYVTFTFPKSRRIDKRIHRMVMLAFMGDSELQVDHINGMKKDNRLCNLRYCTGLENVRFKNHQRRTNYKNSIFHVKPGFQFVIFPV